MKTETSDFQDYGEDERALGSLHVDVARCCIPAVLRMQSLTFARPGSGTRHSLNSFTTHKGHNVSRTVNDAKDFNSMRPGTIEH
jgi:hypothetical protein